MTSLKGKFDAGQVVAIGAGLEKHLMNAQRSEAAASVKGIEHKTSFKYSVYFFRDRWCEMQSTMAF